MLKPARRQYEAIVPTTADRFVQAALKLVLLRNSGGYFEGSTERAWKVRINSGGPTLGRRFGLVTIVYGRGMAPSISIEQM